MAGLNSHASVVVAGDRGILVRGRSGAGKTTLALALVRHCRACGVFARLVADDQVYLRAAGERVVATVPAPIAGLAEAFGTGPAAVDHEASSVVDLVVSLVEPARAPRLFEGTVELLPGLALPCLELAEKNASGGVQALAARLAIYPFC